MDCLVISITNSHTKEEMQNRTPVQDQVSVSIEGKVTCEAAALTSDNKCSSSSKVELSDNESLKHSLLQSAIKVSDKKLPAVYELQMNQTYCDDTNQVRRMELGQPSQCGAVNEKVIMIVGETGCGKTTHINSMVNYIYGVTYEDGFRLKILTDTNEQELQHNQAKSQTQWVTSYTFHHTVGCQQDCTFTLVDTPGFGDTGGIEADKKIVDRIRAFFSCKGGIDHLDAVGFVVKASSSRLTQTEKYVFDSILSLFGKDIGNNIFILVTFADANEPPVLQTLKEAQIRYNSSIKFNNSAVFSPRDSSDQMAMMFNKMFWDMGMQSFKTFFSALMKMEPKSLTLTRDVLSERERLQVHVVGIKQQIDEGLNKLNQLEADIDMVKTHEKDIELNKDFTTIRDVPDVQKVDIEKGTYITNCLTCNRTCHYPCALPNDEDKMHCAAMRDGKCTACTLHCMWREHYNMSYKFVVGTKKVTITSEDLKSRYQNAKGRLLSAKEIAKRVYEEYLSTRIKIFELVAEINDCLNKLQEIALKPDPLSEVDYIDKLIEAENRNKNNGYESRIKQLHDIRDIAFRMQGVSSGEVLKDLLANEERVMAKYSEFLEGYSISDNLRKRMSQFKQWFK